MSYASYQHGAPENGDTSNVAPKGADLTRVHAVKGTVSVQGDRVEQRGYASFNAADLNEGVEGLYGTAKTPWGSPKAGGDLGPKDRVTLSGYGETTVEVAERLGLIAKGPYGRYVEVAPEAPQAAQNGRGEAGESESVALPDAGVERDLGDLCGRVSAGTQTSVLMQLVNDGAMSPNALSRAASEAGISPAEMGARVERVYAGFERQAREHAVSLGVGDFDDFAAWAGQHRPDAIRHAMRVHGMERSLAGYEPVVAEYVASLGEHDPGAVLSAEFGSGLTAREAGGKVLIAIPGRGEVEYKTAVKAGIITVRSRQASKPRPLRYRS